MDNMSSNYAQMLLMQNIYDDSPRESIAGHKKVRSKRSPAFTREEMAILLEEVQQHQAILFGGTKGAKGILAKVKRWQEIACCMAPSSPCGLRDWQSVRKKWQEFISQTKRKGARVQRATGGGSPSDPDQTPELTPDEVKALAIIGKTACEGIDGGVDVSGPSEPGPSQSPQLKEEEEDDEQPSGSGATAAHQTSTGSVACDVSPLPPFPKSPTPPASRPRRVRIRSSRPPLSRCTLSDSLMAFEREKLVLLRGIATSLATVNTTQQEMLELRREEMELRREEMELQRRQLALAEARFNRPSDSVPIIHPQDSKLPQHFCKEEEVLADKQLCNRERNSSLDQDVQNEDPQIKEEQEELCISLEGEQLVLKQEMETFMLTPTYEESDNSEDQMLDLSPDETQSSEEEEHVIVSVEGSVEPEPNHDDQLLSHNSHVAESQDHKGGKYEASGSTGNAETRLKKRCHKSKNHTNNENKSLTLKIHSNIYTGKQQFECDFCGKAFKNKVTLQRHLRVHTGEKPYTCNTCEKGFSNLSNLKCHMVLHKGVVC